MTHKLYILTILLVMSIATVQPIIATRPMQSSDDNGGGEIAFRSNRDGNWEIYLMNADGSNQQNLTNNSAEDMYPAWSPDGMQLVFASDRDGNQELYVMDADGSNVRRLTDSPRDDYQPVWSPDGGQIAFVSRRNGGRRQVFVMDVDGSNVESLTSSGENWCPDWSPDGTQIAFCSDRGGLDTVYVMSADGSGQQQLNESIDNEQFYALFPAWSPGGEQIAFVSISDRGWQQIFVMDVGDSNPQEIMSDIFTLNFSWSPDGTQIAFSGHSLSNNLVDIHVMNADGTSLVQLTFGDQGRAASWRPVPSDDYTDGGGVIAFSSEQNGNNDIYTMNIDGSNIQRLTDYPERDGYPAYSPDGTKIAFYAYHNGMETWSIHLMDADGGNRQRLTNIKGIRHNAPVWSPDGTTIMYGADYDIDHQEIWLMNADGSNQRRLMVEGSEESSLARMPEFSPDGTTIIFVSDRDGDSEIYIMDVDGTNLQRLTDNDSDDWWPDWSPNDEQIAFMSDRDGDYEIYIMDVDGTNVQQLTDNNDEDWRPKWSSDSSHLIFTCRPGGDYEICVMDADGSNNQQLTDNYVNDIQPTWQTRMPDDMSTNQSTPQLDDTQIRASDEMVMVYVPGGEFEMGSTDAEIESAYSECIQSPVDNTHCERRPRNESPLHTVILSDFWIDRTEITNAQYVRCVENGGCRESRLADNPTYNGDNYPVAGIPWQDAADYCAWAGGRLPTEAEWEYAARGTERRIYPWGSVFDCAGGNFFDDFTECADGYANTAPVGSFPVGVSWCGALDMAGNVWEWVSDKYEDYPTAAQINPTEPSEGDQRVLRGGSWGYDQDGIRTAYRYPVPPSANYFGVGFRCVTIPGGE
jgi:Tol biopolymer transport system component